MENNTIKTNPDLQKPGFEEELDQLHLTPENERHLLSTSKWSIFIAVVGFLFSGLMLVVGIIMIVLNRYSNDFQDFQVFPIPGIMSYLGLFYILLAVFYFFPSLFLIQFAAKTKKALKNRTQTDFDSGFLNMKKLALFVGIMTIIALVLTLSLPVLMGILGAMGQMGGM